MLILVILVQELTLDLRLYHITDWSPWAVAVPLLAGLPVWAVWTWLKIWAVKRTESS
jgi:hypothetical protein